MEIHGHIGERPPCQSQGAHQAGGGGSELLRATPPRQHPRRRLHGVVVARNVRRAPSDRTIDRPMCSGGGRGGGGRVPTVVLVTVGSGLSSAGVYRAQILSRG